MTKVVVTPIASHLKGLNSAGRVSATGKVSATGGVSAAGKGCATSLVFATVGFDHAKGAPTT